MEDDSLTLTQLLNKYRSGDRTPEQTIETVYDRIRANETNAWITLRDKEAVLADANALDTPADQPLYGVPFAVKDNIDVAGLPTTAACPAYTYEAKESATVVEKLLSLSVVVLYITLLTTVLYGGAIPTYTQAVGAELGDRVLAEATAGVEQTVPSRGRSVTVTRRIEIPATIDGAAYRIRANGTHLLLIHPDKSVSSQSRPVVPDSVGTVTGEWDSGAETAVRVTGTRADLTVRLEERG